MTIHYSLEPQLNAREYIELMSRTSLGVRRPIDDPERVSRMIAEADILITARAGDRLVGLSRAITDFSFCTYLSDLAVDEEYQRQGIGRELLRRTHEAAGLNTSLLLIAAPEAEGYYSHIGLTQHHSCWWLPRK